MSFHWKQEELKFNTVLRRLQHRAGDPPSPEALQPGRLRLAKVGFWGCVGAASWISTLIEPLKSICTSIFAPTLSVFAQLDRNACQRDWAK